MSFRATAFLTLWTLLAGPILAVPKGSTRPDSHRPADVRVVGPVKTNGESLRR